MTSRLKLFVKYLLRKRYYPDVLNAADTIDRLIANRASLCRFGDGEFALIMGLGIGFQGENAGLGQRLQEIISAGSTEKTLVAIPNVKQNIRTYNDFAVSFWRNQIIYNAKKLSVILKRDDGRKYYDASLTRPYMDYRAREQNKAGARFAEIARLWSDRDVLIVEGELSRFGVGNDLLAGAKSVKRIVAPAKNAFDVYDEILATTVGKATEIGSNVLILTVLGPTATVLSYDLAQKGFQSVDIGHLDIEYEWYLRRAGEKIAIPGKYVNEAGGYSDGEFDRDAFERYKSGIVAEIGRSADTI